MYFFDKYSNIIFIYLKLEIALAIPASNEWKIPTNNSAAHALTMLTFEPSRCIEASFLNINDLIS